MAYKDIREELARLLKAVDGIGQVHEFRRHSSFWRRMYKRHFKDGRVNNWEITRLASPQDLFAVQGAATVEPYFNDHHAIQVIGQFSVKDEDESELKFQDIIDRCKDAVRFNIEFNQLVLIPRPLQLDLVEHRMFGGVFVHWCELSLLATERIGGI